MTQYDHYLMFRVGQIHAMVTQMHGRICANHPEAPSKNSIVKGMAGEFGRTMLRVLTPIAWPYLVALLSWVGAMIVLGYKLVLRFIVGS